MRRSCWRMGLNRRIVRSEAPPLADDEPALFVLNLSEHLGMEKRRLCVCRQSDALGTHKR